MSYILKHKFAETDNFNVFFCITEAGRKKYLVEATQPSIYNWIECSTLKQVNDFLNRHEGGNKNE